MTSSIFTLSTAPHSSRGPSTTTRMPPKPQNPRKAKLFSSRTIRTQTNDPSVKEGLLDIHEYVASREFEIRSMELSQINTKNALSTRVFQNLPRVLRRRTASHNVKRIPKRLRAKALREMQNSVNGVPARKPHLRGRELHRVKMQIKMLKLSRSIKELGSLPKVDGVTKKEKLAALNKQVRELSKTKRRALNNGVGAYDNSSEGKLAEKPKGNIRYSHRQKDYVWLPTHVWHAKRFHMMKNWGFQIPMSPNQKCFRATSRAAKLTCLAYETSYFGELIVQCLSRDKLEDLVLTFSKYESPLPPWILNGSRVYDDWIYCDGKKVCVGSLVVNPEKFDIMIRVHASIYEEFFHKVLQWAAGDVKVIDTRFALGSIQVYGPTALHLLSKVLHLEDVSSTTQQAWKLCSQANDAQNIPLGTAFSFFVKDPRFWKHPVSPPYSKGDINDILMQRKSFLDAGALNALLLSEGRTDSYKDMFSLKQLGKQFSLHDDASPKVHGSSKFPVLIYKLKDGAWCINMPWFWIVPLWSKLVQVKSIKIGGSRQLHQVNFENGLPTFPNDYPFLPEGYKMYLLRQKAADLAREKLPASKRTPLDIEGPLKSGCDWFFLRKWIFGLSIVDKSRKGPDFGEFAGDTTRKINSPDDLAKVIADSRDLDGGLNMCAPLPITPFSRSDPVHVAIAAGTFKPDITKFPALPVVQVQVELTGKGSLSDNSRIYEDAGDAKLINLIGFVTTGSFNLNQGGPSGIAVISAHYQGKKVKIRNVACTNFYSGKITKI